VASHAWQNSFGNQDHRQRGTPLSFGRALARNVAKLVSELTLEIGYVMAAFTSRKQALHDIMMGCVLIKHQV
jgi:uncharacterized RDD family membrane protein YckC